MAASTDENEVSRVTKLKHAAFSPGGIVAGVVVAVISTLIVAYVKGEWDPLASTKPAVTVAVEQELTCTPYIIDKKPQEVGDPTAEVGTPERDEWRQRHGAIDGDLSEQRLTFQGRGSATIVLQRLEVVVDSQSTTRARGNSYFADGGCGGGLPERRFSIDLDASTPRAVAQSTRENGRDVAPFKSFRISNSDPEVFIISATTEKHDVIWYLRLHYTENGEKDSIDIRDDDPFRTSPSTNTKQSFMWMGPEKGWVRDG